MRWEDEVANIAATEPSVMEALRKIARTLAHHRQADAVARAARIPPTILSRMHHEEDKNCTIRTAERILLALGYRLAIEPIGQRNREDWREETDGPASEALGGDPGAE